jgi:hypothetical protein
LPFFFLLARVNKVKKIIIIKIIKRSQRHRDVCFDGFIGGRQEVLPKVENQS